MLTMTGYPRALGSQNAVRRVCRVGSTASGGGWAALLLTAAPTPPTACSSRCPATAVAGEGRTAAAAWPPAGQCTPLHTFPRSSCRAPAQPAHGPAPVSLLDVSLLCDIDLQQRIRHAWRLSTCQAGRTIINSLLTASSHAGIATRTSFNQREWGCYS